MNRYILEVQETYRRFVIVNAESEEQAEDALREELRHDTTSINIASPNRLLARYVVDRTDDDAYAAEAAKTSGDNRTEYIVRGERLDDAWFVYGMRLRGFSIGCQPRRGFVCREDDATGKYYDIIVYNRPLTADEIRDFELDFIGIKAANDVFRKDERGLNR